MRINYSDVCKDNNTMNEFLGAFPTMTYQGTGGLAYGYFNVDYNGSRLSITIQRHATHAGNQYIVIGSGNASVPVVKIPMGVNFEIPKIGKQLNKLIENTLACQAKWQQAETFRGQVRAIMSSTSDSTLSIDNNFIDNNYKVINALSGCYTLRVDISTEVDFERIKDEILTYQEKYKSAELERKRLQALICNIQKSTDISNISTGEKQ